ncbi:MAG: ADP-forming succinate--CoA ligase subunit beta [Deferribacterota bacterium]|nr:ADP-forming succinate--CoA ligase subunit beta [Deferribacterota bacterium]
MNIHEHQAKEIFRKYGVPTPKGFVVFKPENARKVAQQMGGDMWVVKAQVFAGGRGKAGGVRIANSTEEVEQHAKGLLGKPLVTKQTGAEGKIVNRIYIEEAVDIEKEYYFAIMLDRSIEKPIMISSTQGGMEIEEVAAKDPESIIKVSIDPTIGFQGFHARTLAFKMGMDRREVPKFVDFAKFLYNVYMDYDASLIEINPMVKTKSGQFIALDAKMSIDNNALYRQPEIQAIRDITEENPMEVEAERYGFSYVKLDGNIGCMVNGAGLAMATMDAIKYTGGEPANFLDVGGGASEETVAKGFEIILKDPNVKAILINIFGGIVRCDRVAKGIIEAAKLIEVKVPLVVRLDGTNADEAVKLLENSNMNFIIAKDLEEAANKVVNIAKESV